ncbi:MAG: hypothetical protein J2P36_15140, partial [Ktedonobacteraceae bacterium]|nr:hypothetical protein [Ktedonobacteraceae bacterium]
TRIQLELLKEAQIMGYRYADLTTSVEQISAQVIYTKLGFKASGLEILHKGDLTIPIIHFAGKIPDIIGHAAARLHQWQHHQYFRTPDALF